MENNWNENNQLGLLKFIPTLLSDEGESVIQFFLELSLLFKGTLSWFSDNEKVFEHNKNILRESLDELINDIVNFKLNEAKKWKKRTDKIIEEYKNIKNNM